MCIKPYMSFQLLCCDLSWHFSAGVHRASCHWQIGTLQLRYPEETRHQKKVVSTLLFLSVGAGVLSICFLSKSLAVNILYLCSLSESEHIVHTAFLSKLLVLMVVDEKRLKHKCCVPFFSVFTVLSYIWRSKAYGVGNFVLMSRLWFWSWLTE